MLKSRDQTSIQTKISVSLSVVVVRVRSQPRSEDQTFRLGLKANSSVSISICRPKFPSRSVSRPEYLSWFRWRSDRFGFRSQEFGFGFSLGRDAKRFSSLSGPEFRSRLFSGATISVSAGQKLTSSQLRPNIGLGFRFRFQGFGFRSQEFGFGPRHSVSKLRSRFGTSAAERWRCRGRASADLRSRGRGWFESVRGADVVLEADDLERRGTQQTVVAERRDAVTIGVDDDGGKFITPTIRRCQRL